MSNQKIIEDLILFYVKENYKKYLEEKILIKYLRIKLKMQLKKYIHKEKII